MNYRKIMLISHDAHPQMVSGSEKALFMFGTVCQDLQSEVIWISPNSGMSSERAIQMGFDTRIVPFSLLWSLIHDQDRIGEELALLQETMNDSPLDQVIAECTPDLIVSNSTINAAPALLARKRDIPLWWYIHEIIPNHEEVTGLLSLIHSDADRILVPSRSVAESILHGKELQQRVVLLPYGVETPSHHYLATRRNIIRSQYGWTDSYVVIGWFGSIYYGKGLLDLIRSSRYLKHEGKQIVIVAAGNVVDPGYFTVCHQEAELIRPIQYRYLGVFSRIEEILPAADIVVVPSLVEEALPNVVLEAMAYGKSIVAYDSGGIKELIVHGETGILTDKGDLVSLRSSIQNLIQNPDMREELGNKAREQAETQYHLDVYRSKIQKLILIDSDI